MSTTTTTTTTTAAAPAARIGGDVRATLNFFAPPEDGATPFNYVEVPTEGPQRNYGTESAEVTIADIRGHEGDFDVDRHGFAALPAKAGEEADFSSDESIEKTYYPQVRQFLTDHLSGHPTHIVLFDHTVRRQAPDAHRPPVLRVHIDQTAKSAAQRVAFHMGDEAAPALLQGRVRIVNVWRPLNGPVESFPLAMADSATFPDSHLVPVEHRYPDRTGETAGVRYNPATRFWYWSAMADDERILLQCYDSQSGSRVPHTAFADPNSTAHSRPRESIEVRALIFG